MKNLFVEDMLTLYMAMRNVLIFIVSFFFLTISGEAQCIDTTHIQYGAYCDPQWIPVCGCNGITYTNDCFARNEGLNSWNYGICDAIDFNFYPNPPVDFINVDAIVKNPGFMNVQLVDRFGRIYYTTSFSYISEYVFQINVRGFPTGIYYLNLWCNDGFKVKKVAVVDVH